MGAETSEPQLTRKKPEQNQSDNKSVRSKVAIQQRGVKNQKPDSQSFSEVNDNVGDFIYGLEGEGTKNYDPYSNVRSSDRAGNLQGMYKAQGIVVGATAQRPNKGTENKNRICKTSKNH